MIKVLEVGLVHGITNDFDVQVVKVGSGETVAEIRSWGLRTSSKNKYIGLLTRRLTKWCFDQHTLEQLLYICSNT